MASETINSAMGAYRLFSVYGQFWVIRQAKTSMPMRNEKRRPALEEVVSHMLY